MFRILNVFLVLFVLLRVNNTRGSLLKDRYEDNLELPKSLTQSICIAALEELDFSNHHFIDPGTKKVTVWAKVERLTLVPDTDDSPGIAVLEIAKFDADVNYELQYYILRLDNCSVAVENFKLSSKHLPKEFYSSIDTCWEAMLGLKGKGLSIRKKVAMAVYGQVAYIASSDVAVCAVLLTFTNLLDLQAFPIFAAYTALRFVKHCLNDYTKSVKGLARQGFLQFQLESALVEQVENKTSNPSSPKGRQCFKNKATVIETKE